MLNDTWRNLWLSGLYNNDDDDDDNNDNNEGVGFLSCQTTTFPHVFIHLLTINTYTFLPEIVMGAAMHMSDIQFKGSVNFQCSVLYLNQYCLVTNDHGMKHVPVNM